MKRSQINRIIEEAISFFSEMNFPLPPFARWSPVDWADKGPECDEIRKVNLGWDVTDFGVSDFKNLGRVIFTLRNGSANWEGTQKNYSQKVMYLLEGQKSPIHYHSNKMEDIINKGGGNILIRLWGVDSNRKLLEKSLKISIDGQQKLIYSGEIVRLRPGESICCPPFTYHEFWAEKGSGHTLSVEVANVSNDFNDNFWLVPMERFPQIIEDEPARYLLCFEYPD